MTRGSLTRGQRTRDHRVKDGRFSTRDASAGDAFSPLDLSPMAWWDFSDAATVTLNGATVSQINDKSGNNRHFAQGTAASQPTYNTAAQNGLNTVTFDATNDFMTAVTAAADWTFLHDGTIPYAIYAWFKPTLTATNKALFSTARTAGGLIGILFVINYSAGSVGTYNYVSTTAGATVIAMTSNTDLGLIDDWKMAGHLNDPANVTASLRGIKRLNGADTGATNAASGTPTSTAAGIAFRIGTDLSGSSWYGGEVGEALVVPMPSADQITSLETYGSIKWAT